MPENKRMRPGTAQRDRQWESDLHAVAAEHAGQRVLRRILRQCNVHAASYAPGDALATAYNEGLRAVGLWLAAELDKVNAPAGAKHSGPAGQKEDI